MVGFFFLLLGLGVFCGLVVDFGGSFVVSVVWGSCVRCCYGRLLWLVYVFDVGFFFYVCVLFWFFFFVLLVFIVSCVCFVVCVACCVVCGSWGFLFVLF